MWKTRPKTSAKSPASVTPPRDGSGTLLANERQDAPSRETRLDSSRQPRGHSTRQRLRSAAPSPRPPGCPSANMAAPCASLGAVVSCRLFLGSRVILARSKGPWGASAAGLQAGAAPQVRPERAGGRGRAVPGGSRVLRPGPEILGAAVDVQANRCRLREWGPGCGAESRSGGSGPPRAVRLGGTVMVLGWACFAPRVSYGSLKRVSVRVDSPGSVSTGEQVSDLPS